MANYDLALQTQLDLIRWWGTEEAQEVAAATIDNHSQWTGDIRHSAVPPGFRPEPSDMSTMMRAELNNADTYYVTSEMTRLIEHAAKELPCEKLYETDLLTPSGFVYFQDGLLSIDVDDTPITLRAIGWNSTQIWQKDTYGEVNWEKRVEKNALTYFSPNVVFVPGLSIVTYVKDPPHEETTEFTPPAFVLDVTGWGFNSDWNEAPEHDCDGRGCLYDSARVHPQIAVLRRQLLSLFRVSKQRIVTHKAHRGFRRRIEREKLTLPTPGHIRVVTLRRAKLAGEPSHDNPESLRNWTHRWIVRGFWRRQWYPSEQIHKWIWIDPYIKGPVDKPLVVKDVIYNLKR